MRYSEIGRVNEAAPTLTNPTHSSNLKLPHSRPLTFFTNGPFAIPRFMVVTLSRRHWITRLALLIDSEKAFTNLEQLMSL